MDWDDYEEPEEFDGGDPEIPPRAPPEDFNVHDAMGQEVAWRLLLMEGDVALYSVTAEHGTKYAAVWWMWAVEEQAWVIPMTKGKYRVYGEKKKAFDAYGRMVGGYFNDK